MMTPSNASMDRLKCYVMLSVIDNRTLKKVKQIEDSKNLFIIHSNDKGIILISVDKLKELNKMVYKMGRYAMGWNEIKNLATILELKGWELYIQSFSDLADDLKSVAEDADDWSEYIEESQRLINGRLGKEEENSIFYSNIYFTAHYYTGLRISIRNGMDIIIDKGLKDDNLEKIKEFINALKESFVETVS